MHTADARSSPPRAGVWLRGLICAGTLAAAAQPAAAAREHPFVWEGPRDQWVRLEPRDDPGAPANAHPARLEAGAIASVLASVWIGAGDTAEPVFTPEEAQLFGVQIAAALALASADEDVLFRTAGTRKSAAGRLLKGIRVNSGRVFVTEGKLNLILGQVHGEYRKKNVYGQWDEDFSVLRPALRTGGTAHEWQLAVSPGVEFQRSSSGAVHDDWLVFGTEQIAALSTPPAAAANAGAPANPPRAIAEVPPPSPGAPSAAAPLSPEADMERRLRTLKDLHDKGLITEEAYRAKVEEILSVL
jgi:hypothetical protein